MLDWSEWVTIAAINQTLNTPSLLSASAKRKQKPDVIFAIERYKLEFKGLYAVAGEINKGILPWQESYEFIFKGNNNRLHGRTTRKDRIDGKYSGDYRIPWSDGPVDGTHRCRHTRAPSLVLTVKSKLVGTGGHICERGRPGTNQVPWYGTVNHQIYGDISVKRAPVMWRLNNEVQ